MISEQPIFNTWTGDGVTTVFNHVGRLYIAADLQVFTYNAGVDLVPVKMTAGYTVAVAGDFSGAAVTITPAPAAGVKVGTIRRMDLTQDINISNTDYVPPSIIEQQLDRQVMMAQEAAWFSTLAFQSDPFGFTAGARANMAVAFDANGNETYVNDIFPVVGTWSSTTVYTYRQVVARSGASYICLTNANLNNDPATDSGANWQTLASPDGMMQGPSSAVAGHVATFADTTGNKLADGGAIANSVAGLTGAIGAADLRHNTATAPYVVSRAALSALDTTKDTTAIFDGSVWTFSTSNLSSLVTVDTTKAYYVAPSAAPTGASGAWVRSRRNLDANVIDFGAAGDGAVNDTSAIQAAIAFVLNQGGGVVRFPAPKAYYRISSAITVDYSGALYNAQRFANKLHFIGAGSSSTAIIPDAGAYAAVYVKGNATINEAYFLMEGIRLSATTLTAGSIGLLMEKAAFVTIDDVIIETFDTAWNATDVEQIGVYDVEIRYNNFGIVATTGSMTSPNSWSFYNTLVAGNFKGGVNITNANALNWNGGSVQYNGFIGDAASYGMSLTEAGNGYGTIGFTNMVFEGNGGLGDFVNNQVSNPCRISFNGVGFMRTANFFSATVSGAANNGSGLVRLTVSATSALAGHPKLFIAGVVGTTEANSATPWSFTVIDATHIDLIGSTFTNAYVSGGLVSVVGFGTNNIALTGSASVVCSLKNCTLDGQSGYSPLAARPTIALTNVNAQIADDGTNLFQNTIEKLTYTETQKIGDDGSAWAAFTPVISAAGGTFTATATGLIRKVGKRIDYTLKLTATSYTATPTAPITATLPFAAVADTAVSAINVTTVTAVAGVVGAGLSNVRLWLNGAFPITANGQSLVVSGSYQTS